MLIFHDYKLNDQSDSSLHTFSITQALVFGIRQSDPHQYPIISHTSNSIIFFLLNLKTLSQLIRLWYMYFFLLGLGQRAIKQNINWTERDISHNPLLLIPWSFATALRSDYQWWYGHITLTGIFGRDKQDLISRGDFMRFCVF